MVGSFANKYYKLFIYYIELWQNLGSEKFEQDVDELGEWRVACYSFSIQPKMCYNNLLECMKEVLENFHVFLTKEMGKSMYQVWRAHGLVPD